MMRATREWVSKAENDYRATARERRARANDLVCFLCQQCAEKYLKAVLEENGDRVPRTHDLWHLTKLVEPHCPQVAQLGVDLSWLTDAAVKYRYPGAKATARDAREAVRVAREARGMIRLELGLKP